MKKTVYNEKNFLLPTSPNSMACYHAKIEEKEGEATYKLSIHDCKSGIMLHGGLDTPEQRHEAIMKLEALSDGISNLISYINEINNNHPDLL
jgi:hypothetical protein